MGPGPEAFLRFGCTVDELHSPYEDCVVAYCICPELVLLTRRDRLKSRPFSHAVIGLVLLTRRDRLNWYFSHAASLVGSELVSHAAHVAGRAVQSPHCIVLVLLLQTTA